MPRHPAFSVKKDPRSGRALPWRVDVPAKFSETGERQQRFFATQKEAKTFAAGRKTARANLTNVATNLSPAELEHATAAVLLLKPYKATLLDAASYYKAAQERLRKTVSFGKMLEEFATARKGKSAKYLTSQKQTLKKFEHLKDKPASEVSAGDITEALKSTPGASRNAHLRNLRAVLNFGIKRQWLDKNPMEHVEFSDRSRGEPVTLSNSDSLAILKACQGDLLAYHVLGLFCGIRPDELERLTWRDIHIADKYVELRPEVTKSGRRRTVDLSDNALAWLKRCERKTDEGSAPIVSKTNLRRRKDAARRLAGFGTPGSETEEEKAAGITLKEWPQDCMRHTFASNWLAVHHDINRLVLLMGHTGTTVLFEHYHRSTRKAEAEKFWKILPRSK